MKGARKQYRSTWISSARSRSTCGQGLPQKSRTTCRQEGVGWVGGEGGGGACLTGVLGERPGRPVCHQETNSLQPMAQGGVGEGRQLPRSELVVTHRNMALIGSPHLWEPLPVLLGVQPEEVVDHIEAR